MLNSKEPISSASHFIQFLFTFLHTIPTFWKCFYLFGFKKKKEEDIPVRFSGTETLVSVNDSAAGHCYNLYLLNVNMKMLNTLA